MSKVSAAEQAAFDLKYSTLELIAAIHTLRRLVPKLGLLAVREHVKRTCKRLGIAPIKTLLAADAVYLVARTCKRGGR